MNRYSINSLAVVFLPIIDKKNNYNTIVFNPKTEELLSVNSFGYDILKTVDENPGITLAEICKLVSQKRNFMERQKEAKIAKFIDLMAEENIFLKE